MAYLTKDKHGLVQLWNNKPKFNEVMDCWIAWITEGYHNEVAVDITANDTFRENITFDASPKQIEL